LWLERAPLHAAVALNPLQIPKSHWGETRNLAGKMLNEPGQPERQCIVIRVEREEEVGNASAVLVDTQLGHKGPTGTPKSPG